MADHLQRQGLAVGRQAGAPVGVVVDQPERVELVEHLADRGRAQVQLLGQP